MNKNTKKKKETNTELAKEDIAKVVQAEEAPVKEVVQETPPVDPMVEYTIHGKKVLLRKAAMNETLAHAVILLNVLGKPYWEELKKVFTVGEPTLSTINGVFE